MTENPNRAGTGVLQDLLLPHGEESDSKGYSTPVPLISRYRSCRVYKRGRPGPEKEERATSPPLELQEAPTATGEPGRWLVSPWKLLDCPADFLLSFTPSSCGSLRSRNIKEIQPQEENHLLPRRVVHGGSGIFCQLPAYMGGNIRVRKWKGWQEGQSHQELGKVGV